MTEFTHYDFEESVAQADGFSFPDIAEAIAAWGENGDYNEWSGGFLLRLKDGRLVYIEGRCDTTGWGCQDGCTTTYLDTEPADLGQLNGGEWDRDPADLNRLIRGEIKSLDEL